MQLPLPSWEANPGVQSRRELKFWRTSGKRAPQIHFTTLVDHEGVNFAVGIHVNCSTDSCIILLRRVCLQSM